MTIVVVVAAVAVEVWRMDQVNVIAQVVLVVVGAVVYPNGYRTLLILSPLLNKHPY
jgi:hypothetical protein